MWSYVLPSRGYRGFHLTADASGCSFLVARLQEKLQRPPDRPARFSLSQLSREVLEIPNCSSRSKTWSGLAVSVLQSAAEHEMAFSIDDKGVALSLSPKKTGELLAGVAGVAAGKGDCGISGSSNGKDEHLWLWWYPRGVGK